MAADLYEHDTEPDPGPVDEPIPTADDLGYDPLAKAAA